MGKAPKASRRQALKCERCYFHTVFERDRGCDADVQREFPQHTRNGVFLVQLLLLNSKRNTLNP